MPLNSANFMGCRERLNATGEDILFGAKGAEYTQGDIEDNKLSNFERQAGMLGLKPQQVCATYMLKHLDSVMKWVRTGEEGSEPMLMRFVDLRNYVDLMYGIYVSQQED